MKRLLLFCGMCMLTSCGQVSNGQSGAAMVTPTAPQTDNSSDAKGAAVAIPNSPRRAKSADVSRVPGIGLAGSKSSRQGKTPSKANTPVQSASQRALNAASNHASNRVTRVLAPGTLRDIRGLYLTRASFQGAKMYSLLRFAKSHNLNAMVVDVKDDNGTVGLSGATASRVRFAKQQGMYLIARIVTFKDPWLARNHPRWAIQKTGGGTWTQGGVPWVDPYLRPVWDYNVSIAKRAAAMGFDEIQWDYVRFPDIPARLRRNQVFHNAAGVSRADNIAGFLRYAKRSLPGRVTMAADVFGLVTSARDDMGIGQQWEKVSPNVDVICPMMYPSHYGPGNYGIRTPEQNPYRTVAEGLADATARNQMLRKKGIRTAVIRPWLQDFDMRVPYDRTEVNAQIQAARRFRAAGYLLWNQSNVYSS